MKINGTHYKSIWWEENDPFCIKVIDQQKLPFSIEIRELISVTQVYNAIYDMTVRGAPVIGAAGAFGIYLATCEMKGNHRRYLDDAGRYLKSCRPTAVNLSWAVNKSLNALAGLTDREEIRKSALRTALDICALETENCKAIGEHGIKLIEEISKRKGGEPVNILTHCNAGWLACIDHGTATAPVYLARDRGIPVHVWVDETRPRNQGARLTAFELAHENIPFSVIADNTGGHIMQHGMVDIVITGSDRTALSGDTANKIGTYLKALAARDNNVPFYVALPSSSFDFSISDGIDEIPVEERDPSEITEISGFDGEKIISVRICPDNIKAVNFGFDITPARLITGFITERGICRASEGEIRKIFSDKITN
ncbi:MAG TPA: S-methyl-5-thioribose-1-phosphate isomerase [Bacteroidales bacterium]|nr:S-methyl-5-thioribose-1-phosphate isomerase [Bacteroidales bacterium]